MQRLNACVNQTLGEVWLPEHLEPQRYESQLKDENKAWIRLKFRQPKVFMWLSQRCGAEMSGHPKRAEMRICRIRRVYASSTHPKRTGTKTSRVQGGVVRTSKENRDGNQETVKMPESNYGIETVHRIQKEKSRTCRRRFISQKLPVAALQHSCHVFETMIWKLEDWQLKKSWDWYLTSSSWEREANLLSQYHV